MGQAMTRRRGRDARVRGGVGAGMHWGVGAALLSVLVLTGCGGISDDERAQLHTDALDEGGCEDLLSGPAMGELTGSQGSFRLTEVGGVDACQALITKAGSRVTAVRLPASSWAQSQTLTFQDLLDPATSDPEITALVEKASGAGVSDDEACTLFAALSEATHPDAGSVVITTFPLGGLEVASAQACADGEFALLNIETAGSIELTDALRADLQAALDEIRPGEL